MTPLNIALLWLKYRPIRAWKEFRQEKKMLQGKLTYTGITVLAVGWISQLVGVDIAPTEVDAVVNAGATLLAIFGRWRATRA